MNTQPTLTHGEIEIRKSASSIGSRMSFHAVRFRGEPVPKGSVVLYATTTGETDWKVHQPRTDRSTFAEAREAITQIPAELVLKLYHDTEKWDAEQRADAHARLKPKADVFLSAYAAELAAFNERISDLAAKHSVDAHDMTYDDSGDWTLTATLFDSYTGRRIGFDRSSS